MGVLVLTFRVLTLALILAPTLSAAKSAHSAAETGPWLSALSSAFVVNDVATGDLDGDGSDDVAVCFVEPKGGAQAKGGLAVFTKKAGVERPVFHALFKGQCERIKISDGKIGIQFKNKKQNVWAYGKDIVFSHDRRHPLFGVSAETSSTMDEARRSAKNALDGDVVTTWAEGASGTGISETITLTLPAPVDVAYIAILGGDGTSERTFYESNRIHRASLEIQTDADLGDDAAGIDFSDLGIDVGGDRVMFSLENRPEIRYIRVDKVGVRKLELRIDSVFLGKKHDDTHIAEFMVLPMLPLTGFVSEPQGLAKNDGAVPGKKPAATTSKAGTDKATKASDDDVDEERPVRPHQRGDALIDDLDASGRSIVTDDDF